MSILKNAVTAHFAWYKNVGTESLDQTLSLKLIIWIEEKNHKAFLEQLQASKGKDSIIYLDFLYQLWLYPNMGTTENLAKIQVFWTYKLQL